MRTRDLLRSLGWKLSRKGIWTNPERKSPATQDQAQNAAARSLGYKDWSKYSEVKQWARTKKAKALLEHFTREGTPFDLQKAPAEPNEETLRKLVYEYAKKGERPKELDAILRYTGWRDGSEPYKAGETPRKRKSKQKGKKEESAAQFLKRIDKINKAIVRNSKKEYAKSKKASKQRR